MTDDHQLVVCQLSEAEALALVQLDKLSIKTYWLSAEAQCKKLGLLGSFFVDLSSFEVCDLKVKY